MNEKYILLVVLILLFIVGIARNNNFHFLEESEEETKTPTNDLTGFATITDLNNLSIDYSQNYDLIVEKQKEDFNVIGHIRSISVDEDSHYLDYTASIDYVQISGDLIYERTKDFYSRIHKNSGYFFYAGLTLPNFKQWIRMDDNKVSADSNFVKTMASRAMIDQYIKLRGIYSNELCNQTKFQEEWLNELKRSSYYEELKSKNFDEYPKLNWKLWVVPSKALIESSGRNAFLKDFSLGTKIEIGEVWLDLSNYNLDKRIKKELQLRLENWKSFVAAELNKNKIDDLLNNDNRFNTLKSVYSSLALAQWYKQLNTTK